MVNNIKIAVPSESELGLSAPVTTRFGRCPYFTIVEIEDDKIKGSESVKNEAVNAMGGAGPMAAQIIAVKGASIVIGGNYGPNAANALNQGGIAMFGPFPGTVKDVVQAHLEGKLTRIQGANVSSHTGMGQGRGMGKGQGRGMGRNQ